MMEGKPNFSSPKLGYPDGSDDVKYVSKLSTILVATIQEAKDRISQIEYIFCTQLYSNFQAKSKSLQKMYLEIQKEAEDSWKEREKDLLLQIGELQLQNREALEENRCLKLEREKAWVDFDEKIRPLLIKEINQQQKIDKLEVNAIKMLAEVENLKQTIEELGAEVRLKSEEIAEKEELNQELYKRVESLTSAGESVTRHEKEKKELLGKLEDLEYNFCAIQKKLKNKTEEHEEVMAAHTRLLQQIDVNKQEILKQKQKLEDVESERKMLMRKSNGFEEKVNELQGNLSRSSKVVGKDSYEKLLQQIQLKDSQLLSSKEKTRRQIDAYKRLKSQYSFVCKRFGLTEENMLPQIKLEDESVSLSHQQNPEITPARCDIKKVKTENEVSDGLEDDQAVKSIPMSSFHSPIANRIAPKCPPTAKSAPVIGAKRPASRWVDTRSCRSKDGPDPHDDFLNTPLENLRVTVNNKAMNEKVHNPIQDQKDAHPDGSDDETQDVGGVPGPENEQMLLPMAGEREIKYVGPVRKKAERENLKGVECKQCKKFYDAVLPNEGHNVDGSTKQNFRCEHHDGVSRHRYKYVPPMTPEGFWNIGFESEM